MRADLLILAALGLLAGAASAETHTVEMLNRGEAGNMVFQPAFVLAQPGDTIEFVATDRGHNVASIEGILPDGVEGFESPMGEGYTLLVTEEGLYGVECSPHAAMGMVGLIQVGAPGNLEAATTASEGLRGKAKVRMAETLLLVTP